MTNCSLSTTMRNRLEEIIYLCKVRKVNLTSQRKRVLSLLLSQNGGVTAYELLDLLKQQEPQAKPPTVYRALDFLLEQGFVHKVESNNRYILCSHHLERSHLSILFICNHCHNIVEEANQEVDDLLKQVAVEKQFQFKHRIIEIHGVCHQCSNLLIED